MCAVCVLEWVDPGATRPWRDLQVAAVVDDVAVCRRRVRGGRLMSVVEEKQILLPKEIQANCWNREVFGE